jgi:hypothetical protein
MKKVFVAGSLFLISCAHDVTTSLSPGMDSPTGTVQVILSEPMPIVSVIVNGSLVANKKHTENVIVRNVPVGKTTVEISASESGRSESVEKKESFDLREGETKTIMVSTPPYSTGTWIIVGLILIPLLFL